jgi:hypothetical protein
MILLYSLAMGKLVDDFLSTPIPPEVYHYTNLGGFEGILSSGRVWATEAHYTTDKTEFVHALQVANQFLENFQPQDESTARAKETALERLNHAFDQGPLSPSITEVFVASFCATEDLDSQWTNYADAGHGVSLSFDLRNVRPPEGSGFAVTFAPCLYVTEEKEQMLQDALSSWITVVADLHKKTGTMQWAAEKRRDWALVDRIFGLSFDEAALIANNQQQFLGQLHQASAHTSFDLLRIASHCKDYAFHREAEWRLALPHTKGGLFTNMDILHRGKNNAIPYVVHNLFSEKLPLVHVKAGPKVENTDQIQALLTQYGYDVPVSRGNMKGNASLCPSNTPDSSASNIGFRCVKRLAL